MTIFAELIAFDKDIEGYITYVFKLLDEYSINKLQSEYLMTVQYYNWVSDPINIGDIGYVKVKEVKAGIDQWWDGKQHNFYKFDDMIFYKFIPHITKSSTEVIL